jgi:hypothetical protein
MTLPDWQDRQPDFANLFNPAFLALVVHACCTGYEEKTTSGMPFTLAFVAVPVAVTPSIQRRLPSRTTTRLSKWLADNPHLKSDAVASASVLVPFIREALALGLQESALALEGQKLIPGQLRVSARDEACAANEVHIRSARFIGKWLAGVGPEADVFLQFGLRP